MELISEIQNTIIKEMDLSKYFEKDTLSSSVEEIDIESNLQGVSNGFLSEIINTITGYDIEVYGEIEKLFHCPCCGLRTLTEAYNIDEGTGYDICPYCNWEDDGTTEVNDYRSINGGSIKDYRNNIKEKGNRYYINKWYEE